MIYQWVDNQLRLILRLRWNLHRKSLLSINFYVNLNNKFSARLRSKTMRDATTDCIVIDMQHRHVTTASCNVCMWIWNKRNDMKKLSMIFIFRTFAYAHALDPFRWMVTGPRRTCVSRSIHIGNIVTTWTFSAVSTTAWTSISLTVQCSKCFFFYRIAEFDDRVNMNINNPKYWFFSGVTFSVATRDFYRANYTHIHQRTHKPKNNSSNSCCGFVLKIGREREIERMNLGTTRQYPRCCWNERHTKENRNACLNAPQTNVQTFGFGVCLMWKQRGPWIIGGEWKKRWQRSWILSRGDFSSAFLFDLESKKSEYRNGIFGPIIPYGRFGCLAGWSVGR